MKDSRFGFLSLATGLLASGLGLQVPLAPQEPADIAAHYVKSEDMVPMRDGVSLYTQVYSPVDGSRPYAIRPPPRLSLRQERSQPDEAPPKVAGLVQGGRIRAD